MFSLAVFFNFIFMLRDFLYAKLILHSVWLWGKVKSQLVIKLQFLYFYHLWTFLLRLNTLDEIYCSTLPTYRPIDFNSSTIFFGKPSKSYFRHTKNDFFFLIVQPLGVGGGWLNTGPQINNDLKCFFMFFFLMEQDNFFFFNHCFVYICSSGQLKKLSMLQAFFLP